MSKFDRIIELICDMTECDALTASELIVELEARDILKAGWDEA